MFFFQTGGNLDDLLLDIEHLSQDIAAMQLQNELSTMKPATATSLATVQVAATSQQRFDAPQYRSEVNLQLSFDDDAATVPGITTLCSTSIGRRLSPPPSPSSAETQTMSGGVPEPMPLIGRFPYIDFHDTRMPISDIDGSPLITTPTIDATPPPPPPPPPSRPSNLATIRRRIFASKKPKVSVPATSDNDGVVNPKLVEHSSNSSKPPASPLEKSATTKQHRSRRVSIYFNEKSDQSEATTGLKKTHHSHHHHNHRKMSQDSSSATIQMNGGHSHNRGKNRRRHSDGCGTGGEDGGGATTPSERYSMSSSVVGGGGGGLPERNNGGCRDDSPSSLSTRSGRTAPRKMSASSHGDDINGGGSFGPSKIPWCACWGNGCI